MSENKKIQVLGSEITLVQIEQQDFISLTDIAKHKTDDSSATIGNWMRNRNTIEFLGIWETLYNPDFKPIEFEGFRNQAGLNKLTLDISDWLRNPNTVEFLGIWERVQNPNSNKDMCDWLVSKSGNGVRYEHGE